MAGEPIEVRLTVRRGAYRAARALAVLTLLGLAAGIWAAPALAVLLPPATAVIVGVLVAVRRTLAGPGTLVVDAQGVRAGALAIPFAAGAVVLASRGDLLRAVISADGTSALRVPRWVDGRPGHFTATVLAGLQAALPTAYAASATCTAARRLRPPGVLDELRQAHGELPGAMLFAQAPPRRAILQGATMRLGALTLLWSGLVAFAIAPQEARPFPLICTFLGLTWLVAARMALSHDGQARWLLLHRDGLALVTRQLSGEMAWDEVLEITAAVRGVLGAVARARTLPVILSVTATDHAQVVIADVFDAPLASIAAAMRTLRRPPAAAALAARAPDAGPPPAMPEAQPLSAAPPDPAAPLAPAATVGPAAEPSGLSCPVRDIH